MMASPSAPAGALALPAGSHGVVYVSSRGTGTGTRGFCPILPLVFPQEAL